MNVGFKPRLAILRNENDNDHMRWINACKKYESNVVYNTINLTRHDWLESVRDFEPHMLLAKPGGLTAFFKQLYDERLSILVKEMKYQCFPTLDEVLLYENKRYLSYWLEAHNIPHPKTNIFYYQEEALIFIEKTEYPIVGKTNIGASGSGVVIITNKKQARDYIKKIFRGEGAKKRKGPNISKGKIIKRGIKYFIDPKSISKKAILYLARAAERQTDYVILQEYVPHEYEWRIVRIGESFFAHKKIKLMDKASGTLIKKYENPSYEMLGYIKAITERFNFKSQAIDVFEYKNNYLINEMQCLFGQSDPYQMLVDGQPGRYLFDGQKWIFEQGAFNDNECYDLRLEYVIELLTKSR